MENIQKVLIANRGEIALRVIRTLKELDIKTVAVFSEADEGAPHVRAADEAYCIGPAPSSLSYLSIEKIISIAKSAKVDAIHPGYGFLSENEKFAKEVEEAGITFIGPSPESIRIMGSKLASKESVAQFDIPLVPGVDKAIKDADEAKSIAKNIGFPILIKASAGGGGKGMRIVEREEAVEEQFNRAVSEAKSAFGDGSVFIEKYITSPAHIEFQILGDKHGNIVHLFERECSIQRRHQKVIEEAPSPKISPELRTKMGDAAVKVAKSCEYYGAGTVEFIVDEELNFYFLEMNTRLQVEHPVTEMITGIDLVKEQIRVAQGEKLGYSQKDLSFKGHSIELRVYAEDPANNFLPDTGQLVKYEKPNGPGVRVDDGFEQGMDIPVHYDPMLGKLIVVAEDREKAIARMSRAISEFQVIGIETTLPFGQFVMNHEVFKNGKFDTHFIGNYFLASDLSVSLSEEEETVVAFVAAHLLEEEKKKSKTYTSSKSLKSKWRNR